MAEKTKWIKGLGISLALFILPMAIRIAWLYVGPPILNLSADPRQELQRLEADFQRDSTYYSLLTAHLRRLRVLNPWVRSLTEFYFGTNTNKYSECFLEMARHHLDDYDLAKKALLKAAELGKDWNSQQAVGIFISRFADDESSIQMCSIISSFAPKFAIRQLTELRNETHSPRVLAATLATLAEEYRQNNELIEAQKYFELAKTELSKLDSADLPEIREKIDLQLPNVMKVAVNQQAPDIVGQIEDGSTVRLSDFKKKVIFLDFWGDW